MISSMLQITRLEGLQLSYRLPIKEKKGKKHKTTKCIQGGRHRWVPYSSMLQVKVTWSWVHLLHVLVEPISLDPSRIVFYMCIGER